MELLYSCMPVWEVGGVGEVGGWGGQGDKLWIRVCVCVCV